jgi:hypothetical protein
LRNDDRALIKEQESKMKKVSANARRRGIITALVAVCIVAVLFIAALAVDGGRILDMRRQAKAAAESAARTAAIEMLDMKLGLNPSATISTIRNSAFQAATANGFNNDGVNSTVTVNTPPTSGAYSGKDGYIEVIVESKLDRGFSQLMGSGKVSVYARSVAAGTFIPTQGSVLILNPKKDSSLSLSGGNSTLIVGGDIAINSRGKKALSIDKGSQIQATNITVSGNLDKKQTRGIQKSITGELRSRVPPTPDPFKGLAIPAPGTNRKLSDYKTSSGGVDTFNLQPGRYTEDWKFDQHDVVNLAPGTYYLDNKKIDLKDFASIQGDEVTIYSAGNKDLNFHTKGSVDISPPTSGPYTGISLFKDPSSHGKINFEQGSNLGISGAIYAPSSMVRFHKVNATLGDEGDTSAWDNLDTSLDGESDSDGSSTDNSAFGGNIVADMLKIEDHSTVTITGANLGLIRPILGIVE